MAEITAITTGAEDGIIEIPADAAPVPAPVETVSDEPDTLPVGATRAADGSVTLPLRYPVTLKYRDGGSGDVREEHYESFRFRRLTGADLRAIAGADAADRQAVAIGRAADVRPALMQRLFDRMDAADAIACGQVVAYFLATGPTTGR